MPLPSIISRWSVYTLALKRRATCSARSVATSYTAVTRASLSFSRLFRW